MRYRRLVWAVLAAFLWILLLNPVHSVVTANSSDDNVLSSELPGALNEVEPDAVISDDNISSSSRTLPSGISYDEIGSNIEAFVSAHSDTTAGLAVAVFDDENVIYENYFGHQDKENDIVVSPDTVFEWGSVTKLMVWTSLMQLYEQGLVDLNADIRTYLPEQFLDLEYDTPITLLNLMNHEAGFQDIIVDLFVSRDQDFLPLKDSLKQAMPPQIYEPGFTHGYSNWSSALAGLIVEEVSGQSFAEYVKTNILEPLSMQNTAVYTDLSDNPSVHDRRQLLNNYSATGASLGDTFQYLPLYPAGSATGTLEDFRTFGMAFLQSDTSLLFDDIQTLEEMLTPTKYYSDTDIGLNFHGFWSAMYAVQTIGHGGNTIGGTSSLTLDPINKIGLVVMTNQGNESIYNFDMKALIFGEPSDSPYHELLPKPTFGLYEGTRTIKVGPYKLYNVMGYRLSSMADFSDFWQVLQDDHGTRVEQTHWNLLQVPTFEAVFVIILLFSFALGVVYSLLRILLNLFNLFRRHTPKRNLVVARLQTTTTLLIVIVVINLFAVVTKATNFAPSMSLYIHYVVFAVVAVLLLLTIVALLISTLSMKTYRSKWRHAITIYFGLITIIFLVYYNLYAFWLI